MVIRGKPLRVIREALDRFCREVGSERSRLFILSANGFGFPFRRLFMSLGAQRRLIKSLRGGRPTLLRLPANLASLRIKNNARLFYMAGAGEKLAAKIGLSSQNRSGSLAREIKAHKILIPRGNVAPIPQLIRYDTAKLSWIVERFIERCPEPGHGQKAELFLSRYARHLYAPFVRSRPVANFLQVTGIGINELRGRFANAGFRLPDSILSATWPVALLHGDLSEGNMIATQDSGLYIVDWEKFRRGPIAWEMRKLIHICPQHVLALLESLSEDSDLEPDSQMRVIFAAELILLSPRRRHQNPSYTRLQLHRHH